MSLMTPTHERKDVVTQRVESAAQWVVSHWQQVGLGFVALATAGALTALVIQNLRKLQERNWDQLGQAQALASNGQRDQALQMANGILTNVRSGALASQAYMLQGDLLIQSGKPADALASYQSAVTQAETPELKALAVAGQSAALEESQKWPEAAAAYAQFIKDYPEHFLTPRAYLSLGRSQLQTNKPAEAQATLERLVTLYPTTTWAKDAQALLNSLRGAPPPKP